MIALDTNVLVRFVARDDPAQSVASRSLLETPGETFFVSDVVLAELVWTLRRSYHFSREEVATVLQSFMDRTDFVVEDRQAAQDAVRSLAAGGDFADALILSAAHAQGCSRLASFDEAMEDGSPGFVVRPGR